MKRLLAMLFVFTSLVFVSHGQSDSPDYTFNPSDYAPITNDYIISDDATGANCGESKGTCIPK